MVSKSRMPSSISQRLYKAGRHLATQPSDTIRRYDIPFREVLLAYRIAREEGRSWSGRAACDTYLPPDPARGRPAEFRRIYVDIFKRKDGHVEIHPGSVAALCPPKYCD